LRLAVKETEAGEMKEESEIPRRFQAYNVGIVKTGSTSMAGIFERYRSAHEFMSRESAEAIGRHASGEISREALTDFVRRRDALGTLELDSASFSHSYADILVDEFPSAVFIVTIRDCYSWLDSLLNMLPSIAPYMPDWVVEYGQKVNAGRLPPAVLASRETLLQHLPELVESGLRLWSGANERLLRVLPLDRTLIVRTNEISCNLDRIADFVGVPATTLSPERSHLFPAREKLGLLHEVEFQFLEERFTYYCRDLMREMFPGYSLRDFLTESAV
jgi:hypothetical protein